MRHYEIVVMAQPDHPDRMSAMAERFKTIVTDAGGSVHRFEDWGARQLAYQVKKKSRAHYFLFNVECGQDALNTLKEDFRFSDMVIRNLIIRREEAVVGESAMLRDIRRRREAAEAEAAAERAAPAAPVEQAAPAKQADRSAAAEAPKEQTDSAGGDSAPAEGDEQTKGGAE